MKLIIKILAFILFIIMNNSMAYGADLAAAKATYNVSDSKYNYQFTVWLDKKHLAIRFKDDDRVLLWENWRSSYPTLYQLFLKEKYKIEFENSESLGFRGIYRQTKMLIREHDFLSELRLDKKKIRLVDKMANEEVVKEINLWKEYIGYDYADIGDNEADPVLAKLIHQGFRTGL